MPDSNDNVAAEGDLCKNKTSLRQHKMNESKGNWAHTLIINTTNMWRHSTRSIDRTLDEIGAYEILDNILQHLAAHPFLAFILSICFLSFALPFITFVIFTVTTVIMTFTGFVIIGGTLISVASALLFGFLGSVVLFFLFTGFVILSGYFGLFQIYEFLDYPNKSRAIYNYIRGFRSSNHN